MKIKATIIFSAASDVELEIPDSCDGSPDALYQAIGESVRRHGLPEVVNNPTLEFMFASTATVHEFKGVTLDEVVEVELPT